MAGPVVSEEIESPEDKFRLSEEDLRIIGKDSIG
jgi:hypothetical protein